jgi:Flp pilus assembly protein CpaB
MTTALDGAARPARAARRSIQSRASMGHVLMIVAGLVGALATLAVLRGADHRVEVIVARHDLAPGTVIEANALRTTKIGADPSAMASFVRADDVQRLLGQVVTTEVPAGRFVAPTDVHRANAGAARRSMSFPIDRAQALDGQLAAGDHVDLVSVDARAGVAKYVATDAEVLRVGGGAGHGALTASDSVTVTIAVDAPTALDVATAVHGKNLTLVRSTGATPIESDALAGAPTP